MTFQSGTLHSLKTNVFAVLLVHTDQLPAPPLVISSATSPSHHVCLLDTTIDILQSLAAHAPSHD